MSTEEKKYYDRKTLILGNSLLKSCIALNNYYNFF